MNNQRVVVSGVGVFSALGKNISEFWQNAINGKSAIGKIDLECIDLLNFVNGAQIKNYSPDEYFERKQLKLYDLFTQYANIAAKEAVHHSKINFKDIANHEAGVIIGTSIGGQNTTEETYKTLYQKNESRLSPLVIPRVMPNAATSSICMEYGLKGPSYTTSTACSSSNYAIGNAFHLVRNGSCKAMITGGSETPFTYAFLKAWEALRVVSSDTCKPFDRNRKGMILGEGAGILILENLESAKQRNATIYGEIVGFGMSADASHITRPDIEGVKLSIQMALKDAGIAPEQVSHINAHATGTKLNDSMESQVINEIFGRRAKEIPVTGTKSLHGHSLGATSALEAILTILSLKHSIIPPTANTTHLDDEHEINLVLGKGYRQSLDYAISNSFAFGGLNAVLAFKRYTD